MMMMLTVEIKKHSVQDVIVINLKNINKVIIIIKLLNCYQFISNSLKEMFLFNSNFVHRI
jgi:hypothetical protein